MKFPRILSALALVLLPATVSAEHLVASGSLGTFHELFSPSVGAKVAASGLLELSVRSERGEDLFFVFEETQGRDWPAVIDDGLSLRNDSSNLVLLRGKVSRGSDSAPAAGSIYAGEFGPELHLHYAFSGEMPAEAVVPLLSDGESVGVLERGDLSMMAGKKCGVELFPAIAEPNSTPRQAGVEVRAADVRIIDLSTDTDYEFYQKYGDQSNNRIASIVNAAKVIYEPQLGLSFNIVRQRVRTSSSQPFSSTDAGTLLDQFGDFILSSGGLGGADVAHLFTGKELSGNTVGLAWLGVVCNAPSYSTGLTQSVSSSLDPIIFAHEVGHNLGADHDSSTPATLMYPSAGSTQTTVSSQTQTEIGNHVASYGSCLATGSSSGDPGTSDPGADPRSGAPAVSVAASFSSRTGSMKFVVTRSGYQSEELCMARLSISASSDMSGASYIETLSESDQLTFYARSSKRLKSSRGRIYVTALIYSCDSSESSSSSVKSIGPGASRSTRRSDRVSSSSWIRSIVRAMKLR